ncbi:GILT-like protein 1 [Manduca sexta]|uniref:GILT-like protein 1 n=1 Tax=Manduca sexta TaxID=7130 RepID=UPI00188DEF1B|nr:GILT-like protein 1 [Manduca sexta]
MDFKKILFLLITISAALSNRVSHTHQKRQWNVYNKNIHKRIHSDDINTTTTVTSTTANTPIENKVKITVYYETLCPASVRFLTHQLKPVVEKLSSYLDVQLVPYGHARTYKSGDRYLFRCQHGPAECYGNKLHACAIDALQNNTQAVLFNACLMQYSYRSYRVDYISVLNWCGYKLNAPINGIWECVNSERGSIVLKNFGALTHALSPRYVPYLVFDGSLDNQARANLMSAVCRRLHPAPPSCYYYI